MGSNLIKNIQKYIITLICSLLLLSPYVLLVIVPEGLLLHSKIALVSASIASVLALPFPANKKRYYIPLGMLLSVLVFFGWLNYELFKH